MADFDPLGIVKAMGPQTDPFSWAQMYAQDAGKNDMLMKELRNKMLIAEMTKSMQAEQNAADRASREGEGALNRRSREAIAAARLNEWIKRNAARDEVRDWPAGSFPANEFAARSLGIGVPRNPDINKTHRIQTAGRWAMYVPIGAPSMKAPGPDEPLPGGDPFGD